MDRSVGRDVHATIGDYFWAIQYVCPFYIIVLLICDNTVQKYSVTMIILFYFINTFNKY